MNQLSTIELRHVMGPADQVSDLPHTPETSYLDCTEVDPNLPSLELTPEQWEDFDRALATNEKFATPAWVSEQEWNYLLAARRAQQQGAELSQGPDGSDTPPVYGSKESSRLGKIRRSIVNTLLPPIMDPAAPTPEFDELNVLMAEGRQGPMVRAPVLRKVIKSLRRRSRGAA